MRKTTYGELKQKYNNFKGWHETLIPVYKDWRGQLVFGTPFTFMSKLNDDSKIYKFEEKKNHEVTYLKFVKNGLRPEKKYENEIRIWWEVYNEV